MTFYTAFLEGCRRDIVFSRISTKYTTGINLDLKRYLSSIIPGPYVKKFSVSSNSFSKISRCSDYHIKLSL